MSQENKITYTITDEAPALATLSLLPVVQAFCSASNISVETADISLAARIRSVFNDKLPSDQQGEDYLQSLGKLATTPQANIVKLPNISASVPQLKGAIEELQANNYSVPCLLYTSPSPRDRG